MKNPQTQANHARTSTAKKFENTARSTNRAKNKFGIGEGVQGKGGEREERGGKREKIAPHFKVLKRQMIELNRFLRRRNSQADSVWGQHFEEEKDISTPSMHDDARS